MTESLSRAHAEERDRNDPLRACRSEFHLPLGEDRPGAMIESMGLDEATASRLLHGSALEFLGLTRDRFQ